LKLRTRKQQTLKMVPTLGNDACRWFECFNVMFRGWFSTHYYYSAFEDGTLPIAIGSYWIMHGVAPCIIISWHAWIRDEREAYQYQGVSEICWAIWRDFLPNTVLESSQCVGCTPRNWDLTWRDDRQIKRYGLPVRRPYVARRFCFGGRQRSNTWQNKSSMWYRTVACCGRVQRRFHNNEED